MKLSRKIYNNIAYCLTVIWGILAVWAAVNLFVKQVAIEHCYIISGVIAIVLLLLWIWSRDRVKISPLLGIFDKIRAKRLESVVMLLIPLAIKSLLMLFWNVPAAGDIGVYIENAKELFLDGVLTTYTDYSLRFPHLFWMGVILSPLCRIGTSYGVFEITFAILGTLSGWLFYRAMCGFMPDRKAFLSAMIYSYMPSSLFSCMTPTHELIFQYVFIGILWIAAKEKNIVDKRKKTAWWGLICILVALVSKVNQMALVLLIALCIMILLSERMGWIGKTIRILMLILPFLLVGQLSSGIQKAHTDSEHSVAQKAYAWAIYIGGNYETQGRYNEEDKQNISDYILAETGETEYDTKAYEDTAWILAEERWKELAAQPLLLAKHLFHKFMIVWSGTHYSIEYANNYQTGIRHILLYVIMAVNNLIYLLMNLAVWNRFRTSGKKLLRESDAVRFACTCLLGTVCVLLLAEVMNKYNLTGLVPLYMLWGSMIF